MTDPAPLLWLIIGPNGAGKSTYYRERIEPMLAAEFVNADVIAKERWGSQAAQHAYEAATYAAERRAQLIADRRSFVAESVFSHPSKLDLVAEAVRAGYDLWVTFVCVASPELSVARVQDRVRQGGHDVPADKIRERYVRLQALAKQAILASSRAFIVDNTDPHRPLRDVMLFERGRVVWQADTLPVWAAALGDGG